MKQYELKAGAVSLYSSVWHHMTFRDWNKCISAASSFFKLLINFLLGISLSEMCLWKPLWCQITSRNCRVVVVVCAGSKAWTVIWVVCLMTGARNNGNKQCVLKNQAVLLYKELKCEFWRLFSVNSQNVTSFSKCHICFWCVEL